MGYKGDMIFYALYIFVGLDLHLFLQHCHSVGIHKHNRTLIEFFFSLVNVFYVDLRAVHLNNMISSV